jgi:N-acylneuraminate cytidylyltransferase
MNAIAFIFARGGSKGLPGKNIRQFGGAPLIARAIKDAFEVKRIQRVIVSTDSDEIAAVGREFGAEVPFLRPSQLSQDNSTEWLAWRHALNYLLDTTGALPEVMVSLPATAPLREVVDIENCLDAYEKGGADIVVTVTQAHRSPYFNMVKNNPDGTVGLIIPPSSTISRRQDTPEVYDMTTVCYVANPEYVMKKNGIFDGRVRAVIVPNARAIDIDSALDFQIAECLLNIKENNGDN